MVKLDAYSISFGVVPRTLHHPRLSTGLHSIGVIGIIGKYPIPTVPVIDIETAHVWMGRAGDKNLYRRCESPSGRLWGLHFEIQG
jgi:hypothetical protein